MYGFQLINLRTEVRIKRERFGLSINAAVHIKCKAIDAENSEKYMINGNC